VKPLPPARLPASPLRRRSGLWLNGALVGAALVWLAWPWLRPLLLLRQGIDTAGQMAALGRWRPQLPDNPHQRWRPVSAPALVWLVSDPAHLPRARLAAQIALGPAGTRVLPLPAPLPGSPPNPTERVPDRADWPLWRDALRLQLWRLSGSTGAALRPELRQRKHSLCFGPKPGT